ncbi:hypothetical protein E4U38_001563 [Claviceps purpurea]|nr:hypothetical protein E4U38_001563 [Claviceps purpurea]KAG6285853.1 hypothetical protein E4U46_005411 [Claviceps purpurea]
MVKILSMFMTTLATVGPIVQAGPCTPGLKYCGFTLKNYDRDYAPSAAVMKAQANLIAANGIGYYRYPIQKA